MPASLSSVSMVVWGGGSGVVTGHQMQCQPPNRDRLPSPIVHMCGSLNQRQKAGSLTIRRGIRIM